MKKYFLAYLIAIPLALSGKEAPKYLVSAIPDSLKKDAVAVVREDDMIFTIHDDNRATLSTHFAITIFNQKAAHFAMQATWYSKLRKISRFEGRVYNEHGNIVKDLKNSDIIDRSAYGDGTLFTDTRIKFVDLSQTTYPYTVEFDFEIEYKYLYHIEGTSLIPTENVSVQRVTYQLIFPKSLTPRYKTYNVNRKPEASLIAPNKQSLRWEFQNLMAIKFEPLSNSDSLIPKITAAPGKFNYDGYPGSMETWEDYGRWIVSLNKGRDILSESTKIKIKELTNGLTSVEEKAKVLYEYLQSKTRYVNISMGIGGLQPFEALVVDKVGYGDCKGLSNYMVAMLKEVGIQGYYAVIMAGENAPGIDKSFPSHQMNHAIVAVPNGSDTLWLECTSQTNPFNYQGTFTGDRKALIITEDGGKLVKTHRYTQEQNLQARSADVILSVNGDATAKVKTVYQGLQYENDDLNFTINQSYDDQKKWLQKNIEVPSFDINSFSMLNKKGKIPVATINVDLNLKRWATVSGKRIFLTPNLMNRSTFIPEKVESRKTNVVLKMAYSQTDTIRYHLPEGIYPEFLPKPLAFSSRFGEYENSFKIEENNLIYIRTLKMNKGEFPPESYTEIIDFFKNINKADNIKLVFMTKT